MASNPRNSSQQPRQSPRIPPLPSHRSRTQQRVREQERPISVQLPAGSQTITITTTTTTTITIEPASQDQHSRPKKRTRTPIPISSSKSETASPRSRSACQPSLRSPLPSSSEPESKTPSSPSSVSVSVVDWDIFYARRYNVDIPAPEDLQGREFASPDFYAVTAGTEVGIFSSWNQVGPLTQGFPGAIQKWFPTYREALRAYSEAYHTGQLAIVDKGGDVARYEVM
ncbi:hypothetical protein PQX77_005362 [Marasmius sp. AFHP31]|nr:hypothetical protein PQX77_005362 [Marasmius sp. AFHP31]